MAYPTVLQWMARGCRGRSLILGGLDRDVIVGILPRAGFFFPYSTSSSIAVRRIPSSRCVFCNRGVVSRLKSTSSDGKDAPPSAKYDGPAFSYSSSRGGTPAPPPPPPPVEESPRPSSSSSSGFEDLDKPIKFSTSKAAKWTAKDTHGGGGSEHRHRLEPLVISLSISVFLIYFLVLREENDIDEQMKIPLWERVPGLERKQLEVVLQYNEEHGLPTVDILDRLEIVSKRDDIIRRKEKGEAFKQRQLTPSSSPKEQSTLAVTSGAHHS